MARTDTRLVPPAAEATSRQFLAAYLNSGVTKVDDTAARVALTEPATVAGVTPDELVLQIDTRTLWRWTGTPGSRTLTPFWLASQYPLPPALAALAQAEAGSTTVIERSAGAQAYPATISRATEIIAVDIGAGYPRVVEELRDDGSVVNHSLNPATGVLQGGYLVFTLGTPLENAGSQTTLTVRGSAFNDAVVDLAAGGSGAGSGLAGFTPPNLGLRGQILHTTGSATYWDTVGLADLFGTGIGAPAVGDTLIYTASGWGLITAATGVPISSGAVGNVLFKTGANTTQFAPITFNIIEGTLPLGKLPDPTGQPLGSVVQVADLGGGAHGWAIQQPTFALQDNAVTAPKLDAGDNAKALSLRTRLGFPTGDARDLLMLGPANTVIASAGFFPADDTLRLFHTPSDYRAVETTALGLELKVGSNNYLVFQRDSSTAASIQSVAGYALNLQGAGLGVNAGAAGVLAFLAPGGVSAGGNRLKPGQVLGADGSGGLAGISTYQTAPDVAHWTATVTAGAGASGNGFDTATGNTFGSRTPMTFEWRGVTYTGVQNIQDSSHAVKLTIKPDPGTVDEGWSFTIDGHTLRVSDATETTVARYGGLSREYTWANQQPGLIPSSGTYVINLNHQARDLPWGGTAGQSPIIAADGVTILWRTPAAGGSPGQPGTPLTVTPRQDHFTASRGATNPLVENTEYQLSLASNEARAPFSVRSNRIYIDPGTTRFMGWVDWHFDIDPIAWVQSRNDGGNRLFIEAYFKKNGVIIETSVEDVYIRADEDWSPSNHLIHGSFATDLTANDYLEMYVIVTSGNKDGAAVRGFQVLASDVAISSLTFAGGSGGSGGATTFQGLTNTPAAVGSENQIPVWNTAGQLINRDLGSVLDTISDAGRRVVWVKPSTGPGAQYSDTISRGTVLPSDYLSYDLIIWETASTSADYLAGTITDFRVWPTSILGSASKSNIDGSRVDWSAGNRTLSAGNTPDRFLRVVLVRGQGPTGPQGAAGQPGSGGSVNLATSGLPANLAVAAALGTAATAARADHVHAAALPDDSILPAKILADTAAQQQAWQTRIGEDESSSYIFWRSSITSGAGNGYSTLVGGTITDSTFEYLGTTYTVRQWESDGVGQFNINVNPAPSATLFNNLVAHFRGITLRFRDASTTTSTAFGSPTRPSGRSWAWAGNHADLIPSNTTLDIALGEDVGTAIERIETEVDGIRQVPSGGTDGQVVTQTPSGTPAWEALPALVRTARESNCIATISQVTVNDRTPRTVGLASLAGDHAAQGITLAANALTVARPGLYHVAYDLDVSIVGSIQVHANLGNTNQRGSVSKLYPYPGQPAAHLANQGTIAVKNTNSTISLQWIALDIPALTSGVPPAPTAISITPVSGSPGQFTVGWSFSGSRVNSWTLEWRFTGETVWHADRVVVNRQAARQITLNTQHTGNTGVDVRIWGTNASGTGLYAQRTWGTTGTDGVFTRQASHSQTVAAVGDLVVRSEEWSI